MLMGEALSDLQKHIFSKDQPFTSSSSDEAKDDVANLHETESGFNQTTDYMSSAVSVSATSTSVLSIDSDEEIKLNFQGNAVKSKLTNKLKDNVVAK